MYAIGADPACYPGTSVLVNLADLRSQTALTRFEAVATGRRFNEPMPAGRFGVRHFREVHRHIFQDVYAWAGKPRSVRVSKGESTFCYPDHIRAELHRTFEWLKRENGLRRRSQNEFAEGLAHLLSELNAIHAFRDGNGRTQLAFATLLAERAGHPLDLGRLEPHAFLDAMIRSFRGDEGPLAVQIVRLVHLDQSDEGRRPHASRRSPGS